jgi:hypothetical protein
MGHPRDGPEKGLVQVVVLGRVDGLAAGVGAEAEARTGAIFKKNRARTQPAMIIVRWNP